MYHFFVSPSDISGKDIYIEGDDYNHIKNVLRMHVGDTLSISDGVTDNEYRCHIEDFMEERIHLRLDFIKEADTELPVKVYLFQGIPKSDKMEYIIQKAVELGVFEVIPVMTERCVVRYDDKKAAAKTVRWQGISEAAAKQSKRAEIPKIKEIMGFKQALEYAEDMDVRLIPYELAEDFNQTKNLIREIKTGQRVAVFIGPEGGFAEKEIELAKGKGMLPVTLGHRILRTETAAMVVLSWLIYEYEN